MSEELKVMTKEEIETAIDGGDKEIVNEYLAGKISIGERDEPVVQEVGTEETTQQVEEPTTVTQPEVTTEEPVSDFSKDELIQSFKSDTSEPEETNVVIPEEIKQTLEEQKREMQELKRRLEEKEAAVVQETPSTPAFDSSTPLVLDGEDEEDLEYASQVTKNNRKLLQDLRRKLESNTASPELETVMEKLERLEQAELERRKIQEQDELIRANKETQRKLFSEISNLQSKVPTFRTEKDISEIYNEYNHYYSRIVDLVGTDDESVVNKAIRAGIMPETDKEKAFAKVINDAGIDVPTDAKVYMELAEVVDLKNGRRYNKQTGQYEAIEDEYGNRVNQRSLEDAFRLSKYSSTLSEAEINAAKGLQEKLAAQQNAAVTIPNNQLANVSETPMISPAEIEELLDMPSNVINGNPALRKRYEQALAQLGV